MTSAPQGGRTWHRAGWGPLGLLETVVKSAAFVCAYGAALASDGPAGLPSGARLAVLVLLVIAEAGLLLAIGDRWIEREMTAAVFVIFNNAAHLAMIAALLRGVSAGWIVAFALLMLAGELVKIVFLRTTGFTVRDASPGLLVRLTAGYAAIYAAVAVLAALG
ncbi:MAG TPA: hypothetical protein VE824_00360 [Gaiellales bacterium]|nr:hypothetical protein [Gaiellales bacterium]